MSALERTSLEAHVDLCQLRYEQLDQRLTSVEQKIDAVQQEIVEQHKSMKSTMIASAGTIVVALIGVITAVLMRV